MDKTIARIKNRSSIMILLVQKTKEIIFHYSHGGVVNISTLLQRVFFICSIDHLFVPLNSSLVKLSPNILLHWFSLPLPGCPHEQTTLTLFFHLLVVYNNSKTSILSISRNSTLQHDELQINRKQRWNKRLEDQYPKTKKYWVTFSGV